MRSIVGPVVVTMCVHLALLVGYVAAYGGDLSTLVCADANKSDRPQFVVVQVFFPAGGYDGQFYYVPAQQPWVKHSLDVIDGSCYRHVRLLYPLLAWALSGGDAYVLLWVMPF